jgi:hypothetical protein
MFCKVVVLSLLDWAFSDTISTMRLMALTRVDYSLPLGNSFLVGSLTNVVNSSGLSAKSSRESIALAFQIELGCLGGGFDPSTGNSASNLGC